MKVLGKCVIKNVFDGFEKKMCDKECFLWFWGNV